jgi:PBP1b-binding outer membrane lipoprotein LpoB
MIFNKYWKLSTLVFAVLLATACSNTDQDMQEEVNPQEEPTSGEVSPENSELNTEEPSSEELTPEEPTNEDLNTDNPTEEETDTEEPSSEESILEESNK